MTVVDVAVMLAAAAFVVLVGFLVPVLIQIRKTVDEAGRLLAAQRVELERLVGELRALSRGATELLEHVRLGVERALVLLHRAGELGESVRHVHRAVRRSSGTVLSNVAGAIAWARAATKVLRGRWRRQREDQLPQPASECPDEQPAPAAMVR